MRVVHQAVCWLVDAVRDFRIGLRLIGRRPGLTPVVIAMLAAGIGMTTAMFAVADAALLSPLPYPRPERLVFVKEQFPGREPAPYMGAADLKRLQQRAQTVDLGGYYRRDANFAVAGQSSRVRCAAITASLVRILEIRPVLGRLFTDEDDARGAARVTVLSQEFWMSHFGGANSAIGADVVLDGEPHRIVGVLPAGFRLVNPEGDHYDAWIPGVLDAGRWAPIPIVIVHAVARLRPGYGLAGANAELAALAKSLQRRRPVAIAAVGWPDEVRRQAETPVLLVCCAVSVVLLISCVNAANLLLARALARGKEITLRCALGAPRGRIVRQLLTEGVAVSSISMLAGLALAFVGKGLLAAHIASRVPVLGPVAINHTVLAFNCVLGVGTGVLFALAPALQATRPNLIQSLNENGRGTAGPGVLRLRQGLVMGEVALAVVATIVSGLLVRSLLGLQRVDCGYDARHVTVGTVDLDEARYSTLEAQAAFGGRVLQNIAASPLVTSAAVSSDVPLGGLMFQTSGLEIEGQSGAIPASMVGVVSPRFFETMGTPLGQGREFTPSDVKGAPQVAIVNRSFSDSYCKDGCVGRRLSHWRKQGVWMVIVGVVGDTRFSPEDAAMPEVFRPIAQEGTAHQEFVIRSKGSPAAAAEALRRAARDADRDQPVHGVATLEERQREFLAPRRAMLELIGMLGTLALALALIGAMGVMYHSVAEERRSIAIRMAVGAGPLRILRRQMSQGMRPVVAGLLFGALGSYGLSRWIRHELWGVSSTDATAWAAALAAIMLSGCVACLVPALTAARMEVSQALRGE